MARPGTRIVSRESPPARSAPTDTGVWFVVGLSDRGGPEDVTDPVRNLDEFERRFGGRVNYSVLYDAVETYFREGGSRLYMSRVVGPAAAVASVVLDDGAAADTLRIDAESAGEWANGAADGLSVEVVAGSAAETFVLIVRLGGDEVERSPDLADKAAAIAWSLDSDYIRAVDEAPAAGDPAVVAATNLAGGADDRASVTDAEWAAALARFNKDLGPGQVSAPGRTTAVGHQQLKDHQAANNRWAVLDPPDVPTAAGNQAAANNARAQGGNNRGAFIAGPWITVPGLVAGTSRTVPPSALIAALVSRNDGANRSPNEPAAGDLGIARWATGLSQPGWTDAEREALNNSGFNVIRMLYGSVRVYGWRSLVDSVAEPDWINAGNARLYMAIAAEAEVIAERFLFDELDGRGLTISAFGGELTGMLLPYYEAGSLYGESPGEAFYVDVGQQVNTPETIANGELRAVLALRMSPFAEEVTIEIVKVKTTEDVA